MKVALYVRESPSLAENEDTIESQIQAIEEKIKEDANELVGKYVDNGWAGDLLARPDLDRLRDDASTKQFEAVYMFDRSRLARKYWLQELVLEELLDKNLEVIFLKEPKAESDEDKVVQGIKGLFAEYERAKITERTRRGRLFRAKQGLLVGHEAPYGYRYVRPEGGRDRWYEVNDEEAKVVKMIFHWLAYDHYSTRKIILELYKLGIRPQGEKETWASSTISRLIKREDYIGKGYYNKSYNLVAIKPQKVNTYKRHKKTSRKAKPRQDWLSFSVPPIIDEATFRLAQEQIKKNQEMSPRNIKRDYLLRGLIFCSICNSRYAGETTRGTRYYRSTLRIRKFPLIEKCTCSSINSVQIEDIIWDSLTGLLGSPTLIKEQYKRFSQKKITQINSGRIFTQKLENQLENLARAEKRLIDAYTSGALTLDQIKDKNQQLKHEKEKIELQKHDSEGDGKTTLFEKVNFRELCTTFKQVLENVTPEKKEQLVHLLLEDIKIKQREITIRGYVPVLPDSESVLYPNIRERGKSLRCNVDFYFNRDTVQSNERSRDNFCQHRNIVAKFIY